MAVECGKVVEAVSGRGKVEASPQSACASCSAGGTCALGRDGKSRYLWADNRIGAREGDQVEFRIGEGAVVGMSAVLYLMPVVFLVAGIALGMSAHRRFSLDGESAAAIFGTAGLMMSVVFVKLLSRLMGKRRSFQPELTRIVPGARGGKNS